MAESDLYILYGLREYSQPFVSMGLHRWIQLTKDRKYLGKSSRKFQKANLNLPHSSNYLHSVCIILGIASNLEMIKVYGMLYIGRLYANSIFGFWYEVGREILEPSPRYQGMTVYA